MKNPALILSLITLALISTVSVSGSYTVMQDVAGLSLKLQADKERYLPGELVSLHFGISNDSSTPLLVYREISVWDGNLRVFIASEDQRFKEYVGPAWGTRDTLPGETIKLLPSQAFETEATILWNQKAETSHLSKLYAAKVHSERVNTDYAFTEAGKYYIKAVLSDPKTGTTVESAPLTIFIDQPRGIDAEVWTKLKQDPNYAFFIQTGGLSEHPKGSKTAKVASELDRLVSLYPTSQYSSAIRGGLSKRKENIERIEQNDN